MPQADWWRKYQDAPPSSGFGNDPVIKPADRWKPREDERDEVRTGIAVRDEDRDINQQKFQQIDTLRQRYDGNPEIKAYRTVLPQLMAGLKAPSDGTGDGSLIYAWARVMDPLGSVREGDTEIAGSGASIFAAQAANLRKQFNLDGGGQLPPDVRLGLKRDMNTKAAEISRGYLLQRERFTEDARASGLDPERVVGPHDSEPFREDYYRIMDELGMPAKRPDALGPKGTGGFQDLLPDVDTTTPEGRAAAIKASTELWGGEFYDEAGNPLPPDYEGGMYDKNGEYVGLSGRVTDTSAFDARQEKIAQSSAKMDELNGKAGVFDLAKQGITLGLSDEAAGVGTVISEALMGDFDVAENYNRGRDVANYRLDQARDRTGWMGTGAEVLGSMSSLGVAALPEMTVREAAKTGAVTGALGGFGYGEGSSRITGAATNAALGGALGAGAQRLGNTIASRAANRAEARNIAIADNVEVARAGSAEGIDVNRAMMDPTGKRNAIYRADASPGGGPTLQRGMERIEGQIEGRVAALGNGGTPMKPERAGEVLRGSAERMVRKTKTIKDVKYTRAERLAGDAQIEAGETIGLVDEMIAELGENPNQNSAAVFYLTRLKEDLGGKKSVGALRDIQSNFRAALRDRNITLSQGDARTAQLQQAIARDINVGLTGLGKQDAARAFEAADKAYAARQTYIRGTIQRLVGKPDANIPAETIFTRFKGMTQGKDAAGLRRFYASLNGEERADVAATFADAIGKNNKGDFTVAQFLRQTEGLDERALATIFGREGAESIRNLRVVSKRVEEVTGAMNSRKSGSAAAMGGWRGWLTGLMMGGGGTAGGFGLATGNTAVTATGAALTAAAAAKQGQNYISARLLMSPKISKWIRQAPATTDAKAIDAHFARLGEIAKAEPTLAPDIERLRQSIWQAANDNAGVSAAAGNTEEQQAQQ